MLQIDNRVGSKELAPLFSLRTPHELTRLEYADYAFLGNGPGEIPTLIGVERKALTDLLSSMTTGRLSGHQMIGLLSAYECVYILVEGIWRSDRYGILESFKHGKWEPMSMGTRHFMAKEVTNYLNTLAILGGVKIWQTANQVQSAQWLESIYSWWQKPWKDHTSHLQFCRTPAPGTAVSLTRPSIMHLMIKELPGIGWKKGKAIAERFPTMWDLITAPEEDIRKVPGISKTLAYRILTLLKRS